MVGRPPLSITGVNLAPPPLPWAGKNGAQGASFKLPPRSAPRPRAQGPQGAPSALLALPACAGRAAAPAALAAWPGAWPSAPSGLWACAGVPCGPQPLLPRFCPPAPTAPVLPFPGPAPQPGRPARRPAGLVTENRASRSHNHISTSRYSSLHSSHSLPKVL